MTSIYKNAPMKNSADALSQGEARDIRPGSCLVNADGSFVSVKNIPPRARLSPTSREPGVTKASPLH